MSASMSISSKGEGEAAMRFLLFREPQPTLRHVENDSAIPFKGDFPRKV
jgi:hypothetical protein